MQIVVSNIKKPETDLRERVLETMKKQVLKKILGTGGRDNDVRKVASPSFTKGNNIQQ